MRNLPGPGCLRSVCSDRTPKRRATAAGPAHTQGLTDGLDDSAGSPAGQDTASTEDDHDGSQAPKAGSASEDDLDRDGMATDADAAEEQDAGSGRETASTDAAAETSCEVVVGAELAPASFMTDTLAGLPVCTECDVVIWSNSPTMECKFGGRASSVTLRDAAAQLPNFVPPSRGAARGATCRCAAVFSRRNASRPAQAQGLYAEC